jgi:hypothetical protein
MSQKPLSIFAFPSGLQFLQFLRPRRWAETEELPQNDAQQKTLLQNNAQGRLLDRIFRLKGVQFREKKGRLDTDYKKNWTVLLEAEPKNGYGVWFAQFKDKEHPSKLEEDIVDLGEAFGIETAWVFSRYPSVDKFLKQPCHYLDLLLYAIASAAHEEGHTSISKQLNSSPRREDTESVMPSPIPSGPNKVKEDQLGGATHPFDPQPAFGGPANERGNVVGSVKRPNDEERRESKRICLGSEQQGTHEFNGTMSSKDAISTSISVTDQEPWMPKSPEQPAGVETLYQDTVVQEIDASQDRQHREANQVCRTSSEELEPGVDHSGGTARPLDPLATSEGPAHKRDNVDSHTPVASGFIQSSAQRHLEHGEGNPSEKQIYQLNGPPDTMPHYRPDLKTVPPFKYTGQWPIPETTDCLLTYEWAAGHNACVLINEKNKIVQTDGQFMYGKISRSRLDKVPDANLVASIKRSHMWQKAGDEPDDKETVCFEVRFPKGNNVGEPVTVACIVPRADAPPLSGLQ